MLERRDFLLTDRGTDRDREVAGGIQHQAAALVAGLQAASTGGLYSSHATKLKFTGPSCDVNSLIRRGTKTRAGQTNYPKWGLSFTYDRYGNRTAQTVTSGTAYANSVAVN